MRSRATGRFVAGPHPRRVLHLHLLDVPQPGLGVDGRGVAEPEVEELVIGRLAGHPRPEDPRVPEGQLEQHLAGVADADVAEVARIHLRVPAHVLEDGQLILELQRRPVHDLHALAPIDQQRAAAVEPEVHLGAVPPPPAGVAGGEEALHDVRAGVHPLPQPADPAPAVAVGEVDEREPPLVGGRAHHIGDVQAVTRLGQVVRRGALRPLDVFHEDRLAGAPLPGCDVHDRLRTRGMGGDRRVSACRGGRERGPG